MLQASSLQARPSLGRNAASAQHLGFDRVDNQNVNQIRKARAESFNHGRDLAAWLGLVPRQFTTGGKPKLLGISKRGNKYLRKQLIHGARAALPHIAERDTPLGRWAKELMRRAHRNVAVVALVNKLARIAWAVLQRRKPFDANAVSVAA